MAESIELKGEARGEKRKEAGKGMSVSSKGGHQGISGKLESLKE